MPAARILVADDHPINRRMLEIWLLRHGFQVDLAEDGRDALNRLTGGTTYDLVLMDYHMPELDGCEATRQFREWEGVHRKSRLPIIAVTAAGEESPRQLFEEAGIDALLRKPVDFTTLEALLRAHLTR